MARLLTVLLVLLGVCGTAFCGKADVELVSATARRADGQIAIDGVLRGNRAKAIEGLVLMFDFYAPGNAIVSAQRYDMVEEMLEKGDETSFHVRLRDEARAVRYRIRTFDKGDRSLSLSNSGLLVIE
jgi:hypothetical protein